MVDAMLDGRGLDATEKLYRSCFNESLGSGVTEGLRRTGRDHLLKEARKAE